MRNFNEADLKKKSKRIQKQNNVEGLSPKLLSELEDAVQASLKDGYLYCPVAWKVSRDFGVPRITVGEIADKLGVRVTGCQLGFFKVDKSAYEKPSHGNIDGEVVNILKIIQETERLTCEKVFEMARQYKLKPITLANKASALRIKVRNCQLGCF